MALADSAADEVVRTLAAAATATRLYPPTSEIPQQAVERFVSASRAVMKSAAGPVRFVVEPKGFRLGDTALAEGQSQVVILAEMLYAHQVGQLIVAPGLTSEEATGFLRCAASDPSAVREEGGLRNVIVAAGLEHIAVIELTLRPSSEEGLIGLDLTTAPLDKIGRGAVKAADEWARTATAGEGRDEVVEAIGAMEPATRELAADRVAQALLHLDEETRIAVLAAAMRLDSTGKPMEGMLGVVARMRPATLARLLTLVASRSSTDPRALAVKLELPPEALRALELLLRPSPKTEAESGVPSSVNAERMADEALETEEDEQELASAVSTLDRGPQSLRALLTTMILVERSPTAEGVAALGEALSGAMISGEFGAARTALDLIEQLAQDPELEMAVGRVRHGMWQSSTLQEGLMGFSDPSQTGDAAVVLTAAGAVGADAFLDAWLRSAEPHRALLEIVARSISDQVVITSRRRLRVSDAREVRELVLLLGRVGDRRAVSTLSEALDHPVPEVRAAAITALAQVDAEDAWAAIVSSLTHPDEGTARRALTAIRIAGKRSAVPAMLAILQLPVTGSRNQALRREIIEDLVAMGATEALPVLRRIAARSFVFRSGPRALREAAKKAVAQLQAAQQADGERVR